MIKSSSPEGQDKARPGPASWLAERLQAFGDRLFAEDDRRAREHGWRIICCHGGLSRQYRDPRFTLTTCPWCHGDARPASRHTPACRGTGRLCHRQPPSQRGDHDDQEPLAQAQ